jgi:hypothetical protein
MFRPLHDIRCNLDNGSINAGGPGEYAATAARVAVLALSLAFNVQFRFCPGFVYSQTPTFPTLIL